MPRYIDADALLETEPEVCADYGEDYEEYGAEFGYSRDQIANAPTVSPDDARGRGKWIERVDYDWDIYHECSVCHTPFTMLDGTTPELNDYHYCPNCGAKMEVTSDAD